MVDNYGSKWLITMVTVSPQDLGLWDRFQMTVSWLINGGDPNYLLTGMILQVEEHPKMFMYFSLCTLKNRLQNEC